MVTVTLTLPAVSAGLVAVICIAVDAYEVAATVPKLTAEAPVKPDPLMVTDVPPVWTESGLTRDHRPYRIGELSAALVADVPPGRPPSCQPFPRFSRADRRDLRVAVPEKDGAAVVPNETAVALVKPEPVMVTW